MELFVWIGIALCLSQSAMFSGLNLAFFSLSRLRLEAEAATGNRAAITILEFRRDSNFLLTTILWGNVGINVLLTLLSSSVLTGAVAFVFSTFVITIAGEIAPQAYFSRRAMVVASTLAPVMHVYQYLLYPVARPTAWLLDRWLGKESTEFLREKHLKGVIEQHIVADQTDVDPIEGRGALNFLEIDDVPIYKEGEAVDPASVIALPTRIDLPVIPETKASASDPFVRQVNSSGKKWVVLTDRDDKPQLLLDADAYVRSAMTAEGPVDPYSFCHRPVVIADNNRALGDVIADLKGGISRDSDAAIEKDILLLWTPEQKRVITGADILGRLLRGIGH